ncbi:hypothetical protein FRC03_010829 [Tulasnella sp. 419]|nr:hypothetical protein FRC03_010829 [Tulasnella sp. 419]
MHLVDLPPEILLHIASNLWIQDIHTLQLTSQRLNDVLRDNEGVVYHNAAISHKFTSIVTSLQDATRGNRWLSEVTNWKAFCRKHFQLEARWKGELSPEGSLKIGQYVAPGMRTLLFRIDEVEETIITVSGEGLLRVVSIERDEVLWELDSLGHFTILSYAEWSDGFLAFTAPGNRIEIWRRSMDAWNPEKFLLGNPSSEQLEAASLHAPVSPPTSESTTQGRRGIYTPYSVIQIPDVPGEYPSFRMVYPDLVMVSDAAKKAYLWDIPSCRLVETLDIPPLNIDERHHAANWEENTVISYVDITRDYIFVCWGAAMVAYPRHQSGCEVDQGSFSVSNSVVIRPEKSLGGMWSDFPCFMVSKSWEAPNERNTLLLTLAPSQRIIKCPDISAIPYNEEGEFVSVHVSPDGKDLVIITAYPCWLVYVKDFREKTGPDGYKEDRSFRVFLATEEALYTCFDGRRVANRKLSAYASHIWIWPKVEEAMGMVIIAINVH